MRINPDNLHIRKDKQHKDCEWYWEEEMECTNWGEFIEDILPAYVECFKPKRDDYNENRCKRIN